MIPATADLLLAWDAERPRSKQTEMGMSGLGGCRRAAGYRLGGYEPDQSGQTIQSVLGTAIHDTAAQAALVHMGIPESAFIEEMEVEFCGLKGHPDLYVEPVLRDLKTVGRTSMLELWKATGPPRRHIWQVSFYAAGLIRMGHKVEQLQIDYLARDSGREWLWEAPFDMQHVRDAASWLKNVRTTDVDFLPRDYRPGSPECTTCAFFQRCWEGHAVPGRDPRSALFVDDPDAHMWVERLQDAAERRREADRDYEDAKGALDALRPNDVGTVEVEVPGLDQVIRYQVQRGRVRLDTDAVKKDYAAVNAIPPTVTGDPVIKISVAAKNDGQ